VGGEMMLEVCCVTGLATEVGGADVDATLLGGLGSDGKNVVSGVDPFGRTVAPFAAAGRVGEPARKETEERRDKINLFYFNSLMTPYGTSSSSTWT
jgi:hypothetical protein